MKTVVTSNYKSKNKKTYFNNAGKQNSTIIVLQSDIYNAQVRQRHLLS